MYRCGRSVTNDGEVVAALETEFGKAAGQRPTRAATSAHDQVCQIPRYFSRIAGASGRVLA